MSHDPLCPCFYKDTQVSPKWEERCVCDLLTAARAQEREQAAQRLETIKLVTARPDGFLVYLDDAIAAVRGES